jgi:phage virion morphogenesis protein
MSATLRLDMELLGANRVGLMFSELLMRAGNLKPVMDEIGSMLETSVQQRFDWGVGPDGDDWKLSQRAAEEDGVILVDSGRLRQSITRVAGATSVEIGTNLVYAGIHQFGGAIEKHAASMPVYRKQADVKAGVSKFVKRSKSDFMTYHEVGAHEVHIPARPYLGINKDDEREIAHIVEHYLTRGLR